MNDNEKLATQSKVRVDTSQIDLLELKKDYKEKGLTTSELGTKHGVSAMTIHRLLKRAGLNKEAMIINEQVLDDLFMNRKMTIKQAAKHLERTTESIYRIMRKTDYKYKNKIGERTNSAKWVTHEMLYKLYISDGMTSKAVAESLRLKPSQVRNYLQIHKIKKGRY